MTTSTRKLPMSERDEIAALAAAPRKYIICWGNVVGFTIVHLLALYGLWRSLYNPVLFLEAVTMAYVGIALGVNMGAHRYYSHKAFKANFPMRVIMCAAEAFSGQKSMHNWAQNHRLHHRYSDTDLDPHNAKRGFFFSHIGNLLVKKHPKASEKFKQIDMSDLDSDYVVMSQKNYYYVWFFATTIPLSILYPLWRGNSLTDAVAIAWMLRFCIGLHSILLINSWAHLYGNKPYNSAIGPTETLFVSVFSLGEGWHNYHHTFPWDYKASEYGLWSPVTFAIDMFARLGMVWDLKTVSPELIAKTIVKKGDGTYDHSPRIIELCNAIKRDAHVDEIKYTD